MEGASSAASSKSLSETNQTLVVPENVYFTVQVVLKINKKFFSFFVFHAGFPWVWLRINNAIETLNSGQDVSLEMKINPISSSFLRLRLCTKVKNRKVN